MNGKTIKYYKSEKRGSGMINVPVAIAKALSWESGDEIIVVFDVKDGKKGIFLCKKER